MMTILYCQIYIISFTCYIIQAKFIWLHRANLILIQRSQQANPLLHTFWSFGMVKLCVVRASFENIRIVCIGGWGTVLWIGHTFIFCLVLFCLADSWQQANSWWWREESSVRLTLPIVIGAKQTRSHRQENKPSKLHITISSSHHLTIHNNIFIHH